MPVFSAYVRDVAMSLDFDVRIAQDAKEFRALHRRFIPHVVSLDMVMPQGDGLQLLNWLCDQGSEASVLILSGYSNAYAIAAKQLAAAKGCRRVEALRKPVGLAALRSALMSRAA